jgi:hypothetical protein
METLPQTRRLGGRHRMPGIVACRCACTEKPTTELDNRPHRSSFVRINELTPTDTILLLLLTWNCRHLANAVMRPVIEKVCSAKGFKAPIICTPEELLEAKP